MASSEIASIKKLVETEVQTASVPGSGATHSRIVSNVVSAIVNREMERRQRILTEGLELHDRVSRIHVKADNKVFDEAGNVISEGFSAKQLAESKKHKEKVTKLETAIDNAVTKAEYDKLETLVKEMNNQESQKKPETN